MDKIIYKGNWSKCGHSNRFCHTCGQCPTCHTNQECERIEKEWLEQETEKTKQQEIKNIITRISNAILEIEPAPTLYMDSSLKIDKLELAVIVKLKLSIKQMITLTEVAGKMTQSENQDEKDLGIILLALAGRVNNLLNPNNPIT